MSASRKATPTLSSLAQNVPRNRYRIHDLRATPTKSVLVVPDVPCNRCRIHNL